jgi:hypothetical protein
MRSIPFTGFSFDAGERFVQDAKRKAVIRVLTPILSSFRERCRLMHNKILTTMYVDENELKCFSVVARFGLAMSTGRCLFPILA